jgi:putative ABC transport system ATP-binding protein
MTAEENGSLIRLSRVTKTYGVGDAAVQVLHGIDLDVRGRDFLAIIGASGSGKTTLLNIIGCLDRPTTGSYFLEGRDVAEMSDNDLSEVRNRHIGFIFQSFQLIPQATVLENVEVPLFYAGLPRRRRHQLSREKIEQVGLGHRWHHLPNALSGGERQRAAIARALVTDPTLLLADEPTGNLDSKTGRDILALIRALNEQGRTILLITHDPGIAEQAPRRIRLHDGRIDSEEGGA